MRPPLCTCTTRTNRLPIESIWSWFTPGRRSTASVARRMVVRISGVKIVPLARLDHHGEHVRLAEVLVEAIVHLHERMPLRQQVAGTEVELRSGTANAANTSVSATTVPTTSRPWAISQEPRPDPWLIE